MSETDVNGDDFRIVIYSELQDPEALSKLFEQELKLGPIQSTVWIHHIPGVLNERFNEEKARRLAVLMKRAGMLASAVPSGAVPILHRAVAVHHPLLTADGMQLTEPSGHASALIPWSAMEMICVGEVPPNIARRHPPSVVSGPLSGHHYQRPAVDTPLTSCFEAWVTCRHPFPHLRFDQDRMNYECLGSSRTNSTSINFRLFIQAVIDHASAAFLPETTQAFLEHGCQKERCFKNPEALLQYATLQALLARDKAEVPA